MGTSLRELDGPEKRRLAELLIRTLTAAGITVRITSVRRSMDEQRRLYQNFLAGLSKYPAAPPGHSQHAVGNAFDIHLEPNTDRVYRAAGIVWEYLGFTWGGRFGDRIHFDFRPHGSGVGHGH